MTSDCARLPWRGISRQFIPGNRHQHQAGVFMGAHTCAFPYIMQFMHLCYAKEEWWKEFHHWEMEIRPPLPLLAALSADERCSSAHLGKIPSTPIVQKWLTWPFYILCTSFSNRRMDRKTLMKNINYSHSVLQSRCSSQPCTFTTHLLTLQVQRDNIEAACLRFWSFFGEDIENVISLLPCSVPNLPQHKVVDLVLILLFTGSGNCGVIMWFCSVSHLFLVLFLNRCRNWTKAEGRNAAHDWKLQVFIWPRPGAGGGSRYEVGTWPLDTVWLTCTL